MNKPITDSSKPEYKADYYDVLINWDYINKLNQQALQRHLKQTEKDS